MHERHRNDELYFKELDETCKNYYFPYLRNYFQKIEGLNILEIGCGQGGNLKHFYERNSNVWGVDLSGTKIQAALHIFSKMTNHYVTYKFEQGDFYQINIPEKFDLILVHDVIEHVRDKALFMEKAKHMLTENSIIFFRFPAWQMPFGGHQQICSNKICSSMPFLHLLPVPVYRNILKLFGENKACIDELIDIKACRTSIEHFEKTASKTGFTVIDRTLWFINPHYKAKFDLRPRKLYKFLTGIKYIRNYFTTSCFYLLKSKT